MCNFPKIRRHSSRLIVLIGSWLSSGNSVAWGQKLNVFKLELCNELFTLSYIPLDSILLKRISLEVLSPLNTIIHKIVKFDNWNYLLWLSTNCYYSNIISVSVSTSTGEINVVYLVARLLNWSVQSKRIYFRKQTLIRPRFDSRYTVQYNHLKYKLPLCE